MLLQVVLGVRRFEVALPSKSERLLCNEVFIESFVLAQEFMDELGRSVRQLGERSERRQMNLSWAGLADQLLEHIAIVKLPAEDGEHVGEVAGELVHDVEQLVDELLAAVLREQA